MAFTVLGILLIVVNGTAIEVDESVVSVARGLFSCPKRRGRCSETKINLKELE